MNAYSVSFEAVVLAATITADVHVHDGRAGRVGFRAASWTWS
jgi:hypothetical protein